LRWLFRYRVSRREEGIVQLATLGSSTITYMKQAIRVWFFLMLCAGCSAKEPAAVFQPQFARSNILAALPRG